MKPRKLLVAVAILLSVSISAQRTGTCGQNLTWSFSNNVLAISGLGAMENYTSYTQIPWFSFRDSIVSVVIDNGPTSIGDMAFYLCKVLTSVTISNSVKSIGNNAFYVCSALTSITIPDSVTSIGTEAFARSGLTSVTLPNKLTAIAEKAFYYCENLTSVTIPNSVKTIGNGAFLECFALTSLDIPNGVITIGNDVLKSCFALTSVSIGDSVTSIGVSAFSGCSNLTSITIGNSVTSIGATAFVNCRRLSSIAIPKSVTSIGQGAFTSCQGLTSITIPNGITTIESSLFYNCTNLTSITIPNSVTTIEFSAFELCSHLTSISIPSSVTSFGERAFLDCTGLRSVTCYAPQPPTLGHSMFLFVNMPIPLYVLSSSVNLYRAAAVWQDFNIIGITGGTCGNNLIWLLEDSVLTISGIGSMTDYSNTNPAPWNRYTASISSIVIEEGVTAIGDSAFSGCSAITSITCNASLPPTCGANVFPGVGSIPLFVPSNSVNMYSATAVWQDFKVIGFPCDICGEDYSWMLKDSVLTIFGPGAMTDYSYYIPAPWISHKDSIASVVIKEGVTTLGEWAFYGCSRISSVTIPSSVMEFGTWTFAGCSGLSSITIPDGVTTIGDRTFSRCSSLTSINIPNSVTNIENYAFEHCLGLTSVIIPDNITTIGEGAFYFCSNLASITCNALQPPMLGDNVFFNVDKTIPVYVLQQSVELYRAANQWKQFTNIISKEDAVENIEASLTQTHKSLIDGHLYILLPDGTRYSATGQRVK